jgi:hypothetical protein
MLEAKILWFAVVGALVISVIAYAALRRGDIWLVAQCSNGRCLAALKIRNYARPLRALDVLVALCLIPD